MAVSTTELTRRRARKLLKRGFVTPAPLLSAPADARTRLVLVPLEDRVVPAITGTVFQDYNANGQFDTNRTIPNASTGTVPVAVDRGVPAITVTAYDSSNAVAGTTTTNAAGQYTLTPAGTGPFRVEFSGLPTGYSFGPVGTNRTTAVQFVPNTNSGNVNLAVIRPEDYSVDNPLLVTQQYVFGGISPTDENNGRAVLVGTKYDSGAPADDPNLADHQKSQPQPLAVAQNQIGATWGLGYNQATNRVYTAAFTKVHSGYGPNGPGAIYVTGTSGTTANVFADLNNLFPADSPGGNLGNLYLDNANNPVGFRNDIPGPGATQDQLFQYWVRDGLRRVVDKSGVARDVGWDAVGKTALGGLDLSADGSRVFVTALGDRRLYSLPTTGPITAATVQRFNIPIPNDVTGRTADNPLGDLRPFAVQQYRGLIYVGAVNSAESTQNKADLKAYVFAFDPAKGAFVNVNRQVTTTEPVVEFALNYPRGIVHMGGNADPSFPGGIAPPDPAAWNPWSPTFKSNPKQPQALGRVDYPQPMLTGLAFDAAGNMTLGIRDRLGDEVGYQAPADPNDPNNFSYFGITAGDTLRAFVNTPGSLDAAQFSPNAPLGGWTLESNSRSPDGTLGTGPQNNGQGPGNGEFYYDDDLPRDATKPPVGVQTEHDEVTVGGVAIVPGFGQTVSTAFDPVRLAGRVNTGGFRWFDNNTGNLAKTYELYFTPFTFPQATFAKANGIGDVLAVTSPPPVEIGDRVWSDDNGNGVQDANEAGIAGVSVQLFDAQARLVATATTDANGNYIFSATPGTSTASSVLGLALQPNTAYQIQIPYGQPALAGRSLTNPFANSGAGSAGRDSNALSVFGTGVINLVTPATGADHSFDAGYLPTARVAVGDTVWFDRNNDGKLDNGEQGIDGVTVRLYAADGTTLVGTTTTSNGGKYIFRDLLPGTYVTEIVPPAGYRSSTGTVGSASGPFEPGVADAAGTNNQDHGTQAGAVIRSAPFQVFAAGDARNPDTTGSLPNDADFRIDFGLIRPLSIGDTVWNDVNNDGVRQPGEPGLANVTLNLRDAAGGLVATTTTNAAGGYLFSYLLPGQYRVEVVRASLPAADYISSTGRPGFATGPFEPAPGNTVDSTDYGTTAGAVVSGPLVDLAFGTAPTDEAPVPGGLVDVAANEDSNRRQDFGFFRPLSLGDYVWDDRNNSGVYEAGIDVPLDGVTVQLLDGGGTLIASTTTAGGGKYLFTDLVPGTYQVRITPPAGYTSSTGKNGSLSSGPFEPGTALDIDDRDHGTNAGAFVTAAPVTLGTPGDTAANPDANGFANLKQDFGLIRPLSLGDFVWEDANNNGKLDAGERPLAGVTVTLLDATGTVIGTTTTSPDGVYGFGGLAPGGYTVRITPPAGYRSSTGTNGSPVGPYEPGITANIDNQDHGTQNGAVIESTVTLGLPGDTAANPDLVGLANLRQDFGLFRPLSVGDFVWEDVNNNGRLDAGEAGIPNVPVDLLDAAGNVVGRTNTDANGGYRFFNLAPGGYSVRITAPAGYRSSTGTVGSATGPYEPGVNGTQNNEDHGTAAGAFVVGGAFTLDTAGSAANPDEGGTANLRQDFGLFRPLSVGDFVFRDVGNDGVYNGNDFPVGGVPVRLLDASGNVLASAVTDANGGYLFTNLAPGQYRVEITPPSGLTSSTGTLNAGTGPFEPVLSDDGNNNEDKGTAAAGGVIRATLITLGLPGTSVNPDLGGLANLRQDFGLVDLGEVQSPPPPPKPVSPPAQVSGYVYVDINSTNGIREAGERPIPGTTITLTGPSGPQTTITDKNGFYQFTNLIPGNYVISETQPLGFLDGIDTPGSLGGTSPRNDVLTVTLAAGDNGLEYDFGEVLPAAVFGYVYEDVNRNHRLDAGEPPIPGTTVTLSGTAYAGTPLARPLTAADSPVGLVVKTDGTGRYEFPYLPPGTYQLNETQPAGYDDFFESVQEPFTRPVTVGNDVFTDVPAAPGETRGPLNFGEVRAQATTVEPPTKRDFLGSTQGGGSGGQVSVPPTTVPPITVGPTDLPMNPPFAVTTGNPAKTSFLVTAAGEGRAPLIRVFDYGTGTEKFRFYAYGTDFLGGVRVATGDVDGDGVDDIVTSTGVGGGPQVRVFSGKDGSVIRNFFAYEADFRGGVFVASADVDGDGYADIITGTEIGGGPRVSVFSGRTGEVLQNFFAFDADQRGGVRVAAADFNGDGKADVVATTGAGVPTRVRVFDGVSHAVLTDFAPYEAGYTGGVFIAAGNVLGGTTPDIVVGTDAGGGPRVSVFRGLTGQAASTAFAYDPSFFGGTRVAVLDVDGDGVDEVVTAPGAGAIPQIRIWRGATFQQVETFAAFDNTTDGGVFVG